MPALFFDAFTRFGPKPQQHARHPWTLEHLVSEMRHCSISGALAFSTAQVQYDPMRENLRLLETIKPYDFLFPIWNAMPHWTGEFPAPNEFVAQMRRHNVRAVALFPAANGWRLMSETSRPLLDELERNRILTILDLQPDPAEGYGADVEALATRHPNLPILIRGVWWSKQRFIYPLILAHRNLHLGFDFFQVNRGLEWLAGKGCEDQLIFCSNAPEMSMGAHRCYVDYAEVSDAVRAKIASGNLTRLLSGLRPPREIVNTHEDELMSAARHGKPLPLEVIDMHAHILDEGLQGAGGIGYTMFDGGPKGMLRLNEQLGVKAVGVMSWSGPVSCLAADGNACVKAALDMLPPSWWGLITLDPMHDSPEEATEKLKKWFSDSRMLGLKPYPNFGKDYDHKVYEPWWQFGNEHHLYAGLHPNRADLSEFDVICPKYPNMTFVDYHCGGSYATADHAIDKAKKHPNFIAEITLTSVPCGIIDYLVEGCGADRVVYGSDQPMRDPRQQLGWVVFSRMPVERKRMVLSGNAKRILAHIREHRHS